LLKILVVGAVIASSLGALGSFAFVPCPGCNGYQIPATQRVPEPASEPPKDPPAAKLGAPE
jgi:hypothetical protein